MMPRLIIISKIVSNKMKRSGYPTLFVVKMMLLKNPFIDIQIDQCCTW